MGIHQFDFREKNVYVVVLKLSETNTTDNAYDGFH